MATSVDRPFEPSLLTVGDIAHPPQHHKAARISRIAPSKHGKMRWRLGWMRAGDGRMNIGIGLWPILFVLVNLVDGVATWLILRDGGRELAPVMGVLIGALGLVPAMVVKQIAAGILAWTLRRSPGYLAVPAVVIGVVGWLNWGQLIYVWNV